MELSTYCGADVAVTTRKINSTLATLKPQFAFQTRPNPTLNAMRHVATLETAKEKEQQKRQAIDQNLKYAWLRKSTVEIDFEAIGKYQIS